MSDGGTPAGYVRVTAGRCDAVARAEHVEDARPMLADGSLYEAAARDLSAFRLQGRGVAYAIALPATGTHAVVRHNRHGGKLARLTRDLFLPPTRAPHELAVALRLRELGVPTPDVLMYGTSPAPFPFRRADVVTRRDRGRTRPRDVHGVEVAERRARSGVGGDARARARDERGRRAASRPQREERADRADAAAA